jgi:two-component system chemotaxis sensor kinase CheA
MKKNDHESLELFAEESSIRLARIADDLELLAKSRSANMEVLHRIFRDTHSLKSAANLLALGPVEQIAHKIEDILDSIRSGSELPDEQLVDILNAAYARIEQLLKNQYVLPLIDSSKEIAVIDASLLARSSSGKR